MSASSLDPAQARHALAEMRATARARGIFAPAGREYALRAVLLTPLLLALQTVAWSAHDPLVMLVAASLCGAVAVQLGFVAHDAGHRAVSRHRLVNALAGHFAFTLVNGLGFQSWCTSHDAHHAHCQDESRDPDMQVDTLMSLTPGSAAAKTGIGRRLLPYQAYYLWPLSLLFAHGLRLGGLRRSWAGARRHPLDCLLLPLHGALWWGLPALWLEASAGRIAVVYLVMSAVVGTYLATLFWVNHIGMPAIEPGRPVTALEQQVVGTRNVRNAAWLDFLFGGLNFQIEHHLLPGAPASRLRAASAITRSCCGRYGLVYREESLPEALRSVTAHVHRVARAADREAAAPGAPPA